MPESGLTSQRSAVMTCGMKSPRNARALRAVVDAQEQVAGGRQAVAADDEALDVGEVELGHAGKRSRKRDLQLLRLEPLGLERELDQPRPLVEVRVHLLDRVAAVGGEEQRRLELVRLQPGREAGPAPRVAAAVAPDGVGVLAEPGLQPLEVRVELAVEVAGEQQPRRVQRVAVPLAVAHVLDLVDHHPAPEVRPGHARERAGLALGQRVQVRGQLGRMAVEDRRQHGQRVGLA